jgi:hypothetical protein
MYRYLAAIQLLCTLQLNVTLTLLAPQLPSHLPYYYFLPFSPPSLLPISPPSFLLPDKVPIATMASKSDQCYMTLVMSDSYLPGAMVLGHSLRDSSATNELVALVTLDTLSIEVIDELKA